MTDGCHNCRFRLGLEKWDYRFRLGLEKWDYRGKGCEHVQMEGFVCTAMASDGMAIWMLGLDEDDSKCECWEKRKENI